MEDPYSEIKLINSVGKGGSTIFKLKSNSMVQEPANYKNQPSNLFEKSGGQSTLEASVMKALPNKGAAKQGRAPSRNG